MWKVPTIHCGLDYAAGSDETYVTSSLGGFAKYPRRGQRLLHRGNDLLTTNWRKAKRLARRGGYMLVDIPANQ